MTRYQYLYKGIDTSLIYLDLFWAKITNLKFFAFNFLDTVER